MWISLYRLLNKKVFVECDEATTEVSMTDEDKIICDASIHEFPNKPRTGEFWSWLQEIAPDALLFDGPEGYAFDSAIIGIATRIGMTPVVAYEEIRLIEALMDEGWDYTDAVEWVEINTKGSYLGENTPIIINLHEESPYNQGK